MALGDGTDCNSINSESDEGGNIAESRAKVAAVVLDKCVPGGPPSRLGYQRVCPAPCEGTNRCTAGAVGLPCTDDASCDSPSGAGNGRCGPGEDWNQEVDCLRCLVESTLTAAIEDKYGDPPSGLSSEAQKCQDLIGDLLTLLTTSFHRVTVDCQKKLDGGKLGLVFCQGGQCTGPPALVGQSCTKDDDCIDPTVRLCKYADMEGARTGLSAKTAAKLPAGCTDDIINDDLDTCGDDLAEVTACLVDNARKAADTLADAVFPEGVGHTPCVPGPLCPTPTPAPTPPPPCESGIYPSCGGVCPPGEQCTSTSSGDGTGTCYCAANGLPPGTTFCGDSLQAPQCDGACLGVDTSCVEDLVFHACVCRVGAPVPCGGAAGPPMCWGNCPAAVPVCADIGGLCQCTP
jgi:hypothetical protein